MTTFNYHVKQKGKGAVPMAAAHYEHHAQTILKALEAEGYTGLEVVNVSTVNAAEVRRANREIEFRRALKTYINLED